MTPGAYHIVLDGKGKAVCVIRTLTLRLIRFNEMSPELAALEGEGDLSLAYWQSAHQAFFEREGTGAGYGAGVRRICRYRSSLKQAIGYPACFRSP